MTLVFLTDGIRGRTRFDLSLALDGHDHALWPLTSFNQDPIETDLTGLWPPDLDCSLNFAAWIFSSHHHHHRPHDQPPDEPAVLIHQTTSGTLMWEKSWLWNKLYDPCLPMMHSLTLRARCRNETHVQAIPLGGSSVPLAHVFSVYNV